MNESPFTKIKDYCLVLIPFYSIYPCLGNLKAMFALYGLKMYCVFADGFYVINLCNTEVDLIHSFNGCLFISIMCRALG